MLIDCGNRSKGWGDVRVLLVLLLEPRPSVQDELVDKQVCAVLEPALLFPLLS